MGLDLTPIRGQTPIDDEELDGLLIPGITLKSELDEFEQLNIERALKWSLGRKITADNLLTEQFVKLVHKKMFEDVWKWAGHFRKSEKNLGIPWPQIPLELRTLLGNCKYWIEHKTYSSDEIAIRFKHEIVKIHCFPNGNGRHSRLMADILITHIFDREPFSWGSLYLAKAGDVRGRYISAVKTADLGEIRPLLEFARK